MNLLQVSFVYSEIKKSTYTVRQYQIFIAAISLPEFIAPYVAWILLGENYGFSPCYSGSEVPLYILFATSSTLVATIKFRNFYFTLTYFSVNE